MSPCFDSAFLLPCFYFSQGFGACSGATSGVTWCQVVHTRRTITTMVAGQKATKLTPGTALMKSHSGGQASTSAKSATRTGPLKNHSILLALQESAMFGGPCGLWAKLPGDMPPFGRRAWGAEEARPLGVETFAFLSPLQTISCASPSASAP